MAEDNKPTDSELVKGFLGNTPEVMAELMREFIQKKTLTDRARIRLRMKAVLDLVSADTEYPPVPALNPEQDEAAGAGFVEGGGRQRRRRREGLPVPVAGAPAAPLPPQAAAGGGNEIIAVPGAEQAGPNQGIL